jgi:Ca-activated chloride channel homolog
MAACGIALALSVCAGHGEPQARNAAETDAESYGFRMSVDEVELTFHAAGEHGLPVSDLKPEEIRIFDNERPAGKILAFRSADDLPIHLGIVLDTSESMQNHIRRDRAIASRIVRQVVRRQDDLAFAMDFGYVSHIARDWTNDAGAVTMSIQGVTAGKQNPLDGTSLNDAVFRACFNQMGRINRAASGNVLVLFSDGEDNASHTSLREAVDACQHSNTTIYAFRAAPAEGSSPGPAALAELARETGGRVFREDDIDAEIDNEIAVIEAEQRSRYWLVYRPPGLKHDGAFHSIAILGPERAKRIDSRSGYYAPKQ